MLQFITFAIIFGIMMFIWSFVYLNRSRDHINQAFLAFLSVILLWMILSVSNNYNDMSALGLIVKTVYFLCMFNMSLFFLHFVYRLIKKKLDPIFFILLALNTLTIAARYLLPIDYTDPTFWRYSHPVIAPVMSTTFCLPVVFAFFLVIRAYRVTGDFRLKAQLKTMFVGIGIACLMSVVSEYILPICFGINTYLSLMYCAVLVLIIFVFLAIMKHKLLNMQSEYIYQKLFMNAVDGIVIINRHARIMNVNTVAREMFKSERMDAGDRISDYIGGYDFGTNYKQHEITIAAGGERHYLSITQYPIDAEDRDSAKLMTITDITSTKLNQQREKDILIEKSSLDQLTGLYNKQFFTDNYACGGEADGTRIALLFLDIDNFKAINDVYGHLAGDHVLICLAACIKSNIRRNTQAIRFGGDEFVVVLDNATVDNAYSVAERIRACTNALDFSQYAPELRISLSIGLAEGIEPVRDLIIKADMAMYASKSAGKNMTTVYSVTGGANSG